jgi:hypothetical protein
MGNSVELYRGGLYGRAIAPCTAARNRKSATNNGAVIRPATIPWSSAPSRRAIQPATLAAANAIANTMSKPKLVAIGDCLVAGGSPPENGTKSAIAKIPANALKSHPCFAGLFIRMCGHATCIALVLCGYDMHYAHDSVAVDRDTAAIPPAAFTTINPKPRQ